MVKIDNLILRFRSYMDNNEVNDLKRILKNIYNIIKDLDYAEITDIRYKYFRGEPYIEITLKYKYSSLDKILACSNIISDYLRKQNPEIVYRINIIGKFNE